MIDVLGAQIWPVVCLVLLFLASLAFERYRYWKQEALDNLHLAERVWRAGNRYREALPYSERLPDDGLSVVGETQ